MEESNKSVITNVWKKKNRPIKVLAPMAGYTDSAFRLLCRDFGADIVITELVSADAIAYSKLKVDNVDSTYMVSSKNKATAEMLSFCDKERPIIIQLFGKNPENFGKATKWVTENLKPDGIDINMGCPARKVVGSDHGAALLKKPELACQIVRAVKDNTDLPVSVKTRLGWENDDEILEFAPELKRAGIDAIIIHGRTYKDGFKGQARWSNIFKVKDIFGDELVVIGNGDIGMNSKASVESQKINNNSSAIKVLDQINKLDGYAIGRATFGKPWIFQDLNANEVGPELKQIILRHAELAYKMKGEKGIIEFRKHLLAYLRGFAEAKKLRLEAIKITDIDAVKKIVTLLDQKKLN